jgi:hypothetical protein
VPRDGKPREARLTAAGERWKTFWAGWLDVVADAVDRA